MITLLVLAVAVGIAILIGRNLKPQAPAVDRALMRMEAQRRNAHRHHDHDPEADGDVTIQRVALHEAGHIVATEDAGMDWSKAIARRDGSGIVHVKWHTDRSKDDMVRVANAVAIYRAGEYAEGSGAGAGPDRRYAKLALNHLPSRMRGRALRNGERQAWAALGRKRGDLLRYKRELARKGRLR